MWLRLSEDVSGGSVLHWPPTAQWPTNPPVATNLNNSTGNDTIKSTQQSVIFFNSQNVVFRANQRPTPSDSQFKSTIWTETPVLKEVL